MGFCIFLLWFLSLFIWDIRIEGCVRYTDDLLLDFLESKEVRHGMRKSDVNGENIQFLLRNNYPKITWASVSIDGTRLVVQIKENTITDEDAAAEEEQEEKPRDLLSPVSGVIRSMIVRKGTPQKSVGDTVEAGDVLVSGRLSILNDNQEVARYDYCASDADIQIEYTLPYERHLERKYLRKQYSGTILRGFFVKVCSRAVFLTQNPEEWETYDSVMTEHQVRLLDNFYIPVYFGRTTYREYEMVEDVYTKEEMEKLLLERLRLDFEEMEKKGVQIIENNVKIQIDKTRGSAFGTLVVQEKAVDTAPTEVLSDPAPEGEKEEG